MSVENFQQVYLKEIGVRTPISSFVAEPKAELHVQTEPVQPQVYVEPQAQAPVVVAEPSVELTPTVAEVVQETAVPAAHVATVSVDGLEGLKAQAEACKACELVESRNQLVFGDGNSNADIMFIGEAPNRDDDLAGKAFVGASGVLFQQMLASIGLNRDDVYLMNGVKCRPQHNRAPKPVEFAACESWLTAQLEQVQPKMICLLGRVVAQTMLKTEASLSELRAGRFTYRGIPVLVIDHPSYLLRAQQNKRRAWQDLLRLESFLKTIH
ncbi:MAG TPA: uracil-DNA glycosylase [Ghiorsea sp.]|nr:uracil-DNA glycosylase [Ghiorsea sp.]